MGAVKKKRAKAKTSWFGSLKKKIQNLKDPTYFARFRSLRRSITQKAIIAVIIMGVAGGSAVWWSGYPQIWLNQATNSFLQKSSFWGLKVEEIMVTGRTHASAQKILAAIQLKRGEPILSRSVNEIQASLEEVSWIKGDKGLSSLG